MKIAFCIKIAALFTVFTVLACVIGLPTVYLVTAEPDGQIVGVSRYDEQESLTVSEKTHVVVNLKAGKDDYELPFIPAETEHQWDNGTVTTPPTCTMPGVKTYTCKLNSKHTYTEEIPATGHTPSEPVAENEIAPTCETAGGYDEVVFCSACHIEISRNHIDLPALGHDWGEWECTKEPTVTEPGEETRTCKNDPSHTETREIPPIVPANTELSFYDGEIVLIVPDGAIPAAAEFDVRKIVPPPDEMVTLVKEQIGASSEVISYYEIRLTDADSISIIRLDGEITIKTKMPEQYVGSNCIQILQEDETGKLIVMESWWESEYLCYKTNWLEIYN